MKIFKTKNSKNHIWLSAFIFAAAVIVFYKIVDWIPEILSNLLSFLSILSPFIGGFIIAFILAAPQKRIEKFLKNRKSKFVNKKSRGISIAITYVLFIALLALLFYFVIPAVIKSIGDLIGNAPKYYEIASEKFSAFADSHGDMISSAIDKISEFLTPSKIISLFNFSSISKYAQGIYKFGSGVVKTAISFIVSAYMLAAREKLLRAVNKIFSLFIPKQRLTSIKTYLSKIGSIFYKYVYSQITDAVIVAILMTVTFLIIDVPYPLLSGILIGLCNLIPYFGAIIAGAVVALFTLIANGFVPAIIALACIIIIQQVDANLIQPRIVGESVGIHPIYVLLAIIVGGGLFGFVGILIGVPVIATIKMIVVDLIERKEAREAQKAARYHRTVSPKNVNEQPENDAAPNKEE